MKWLAALAFVLQAVALTGAQASARIQGLMMDETSDTSLAGAKVFLYSQPVSRLVATTVTDDAGHFSFGGITPGTYLLGMNKRGYFGSTRRVVTIGSATRTVQATLGMKKGGEIVGRLLDHDGNPKANVSVAAIQIEVSGRMMPGVDTDRTNANGEFSVQSLVPGTYVLIVNEAHTDFALGPRDDPAAITKRTVDAVSYFPGVPDVKNAERLDVPLSQRVVVRDFALPQSRTVVISGTVEDRLGRPATRAQISARAEWMLFGGEKALSRIALDGSFTLGPMAPSVYRLLVDGETVMTVTASQDLTDVVLRLPR